VINGIVEPAVAKNSGIGPALWVGFGVCVFSWVCGMALCVVDWYADQKDGKKAELSDEDKFKCSHIYQFKLPFWLIVGSCLAVYCSIFPYSWNTASMLETQFGVPKQLSSSLYSLPFLISAVISPFLGLMIDKIGKRALFIMTSSVLVVFACVITIILVKQSYTTENWTFLIPLILLGFAYSVYAGALWSSVPYVVPAPQLGTAFGLCTAVQNIGLTIIPFVIGGVLDGGDEDGPIVIGADQ